MKIVSANTTRLAWYLGPMKRKTSDSQARIRLISMIGQHMMNQVVKSSGVSDL